MMEDTELLASCPNSPLIDAVEHLSVQQQIERTVLVVQIVYAVIERTRLECGRHRLLTVEHATLWNIAQTLKYTLWGMGDL